MAILLFNEWQSTSTLWSWTRRPAIPSGSGGRKQRSGPAHRERCKGRALRPDVSPELFNLAGGILFLPGRC